MSAAAFDFAPLLRPNLPPAAVKYTGFPPFNFVGGHNDAATTPVDGLIAATASVLKREGATLATYGLNSGPLGYIALRQFLSKKLHRHAGIICSTDEILITSGSNQGLDLINQVLVWRYHSHGTGELRWCHLPLHAARSQARRRCPGQRGPAPRRARGRHLRSRRRVSGRNISTPSRRCRTRPGLSWVRNAEGTSSPSQPTTAF